MNEFQNCENKGRKKAELLFKKLNITEYEFSKGEFDSFDGRFTWNDTKYILEIKDRQIKSTTYSTAIMEVDKLKSLIDLKEADEQICYLNFYTDDVAVMFTNKDIKKGKITQKMCNRTTAIDSGRRLKKVVEIDINNAEKFKL